MISALTSEQEEQLNHKIQITAPLTTERYSGQRAVGADLCEEEDFLYTAFCHGRDSEYPLTHILVFNTGTGARFSQGVCAREDKGYGCDNSFRGECLKARNIAEEHGLETVCVDTNFEEVLSEETEKVVSYRRIACALALQGLLSVYIFPSGKSAGEFCLDPDKCMSYDMLTVSCASTESMAVYLSGAELGREEKARIIKEKVPYWDSIDSLTAERSCEEKKAVIIGKPYTVNLGNRVRLCAPVLLREERADLWIEVKSEYAPYLTVDRVDSFVTALLTTAMSEGRNIICEYPVTRRLLYQINQYLIPMMASNMKKYQYIKVLADAADDDMECHGAVGTGWTGGVDSLFTIKRNLYETEESVYKLSHLMITSNGAIEGIDPSDTLNKMVEKAQNGIVPELELDMVSIDSNIQKLLPENFRAVVSIRHAAVILALQKLFRVFLVSSSGAFSQIKFVEDNMGCYELFVLNFLMTDNTAFYSAGGSFTRLEKLRQLSEFPLAEKYLHPCIYALRKNNCGDCGKCVRTQTALYVLGTLKHFSAVFDIENYEKKKNLYLAQVMMQEKQNRHCAEIMELVREQRMDVSHIKRWKRRILFKDKLKKYILR